MAPDAAYAIAIAAYAATLFAADAARCQSAIAVTPLMPAPLPLIQTPLHFRLPLLSQDFRHAPA